MQAAAAAVQAALGHGPSNQHRPGLMQPDSHADCVQLNRSRCNLLSRAVLGLVACCRSCISCGWTAQACKTRFNCLHGQCCCGLKLPACPEAQNSLLVELRHAIMPVKLPLAQHLPWHLLLLALQQILRCNTAPAERLQ